MSNRNDKLQSLCRDYLHKLRPIAAKFGLGGFVDDTIKANVKKECEATETEVELLSRACDDERLSRTDVARTIGKSYRQAYEDGDFEKVKKLRHVGMYSKVSALLFSSKKKKQKDGN